MLDGTTDWTKLNADELAKYQMILWINDSPHNEQQRAAFQKYMENGGGWIGFHVAGYNDKDSHWPWFVDFLGGAVFYTNNWPVMPAKLSVDTTDHPVTAHLPASFVSPANEFYQWKPSPRLNKDVKVLLTLDPSNYPLGKKDLITAGDVPGRVDKHALPHALHQHGARVQHFGRRDSEPTVRKRHRMDRPG